MFKIFIQVCNCYLKALATNKETTKAREYLIKAEKFYPYEQSVINLKEMLVDLNENEAKASNQLLYSSPDTNYADNEKKALEWEKFLTKALIDDYSNEDIHFKLIKLFIKTSNISKLFKHVLKSELTYTFSSSKKWYIHLIDQLEACFANLKGKNLDSDDLEHVNILLLIGIYRHLLSNIQINSFEASNQVELFFKFDKYIREFELGLKEKIQPYQKLIFDEFKAQYLYACALLLMRINSGSSGSFEENIFKAFLLKSLVVSRPNNPFFLQYLEKSVNASKSQGTKKELIDLVCVVHNDSAWRYSTIGNWLKFMTNSQDDTNYFKRLHLTDANEIREYFLSNFKKSFENKIFSKENSFLVSVNETLLLHLNENEKIQALNVNDSNFKFTLEHADKYTLFNQSKNLRFLVWHTLANTNFYPSDSVDLKEILPYCKCIMYLL